MSDSSLNGKLLVASDISTNGNVYVKNDMNISGNLITSLLSTSSLKGPLNVGLDTTLKGNLFIHKDCSLNGNLIVLADSSLNGNLIVGGQLNIKGDTFLRKLTTNGDNYLAGGDTYITGNLYSQNYATITSGLSITGGGLNSESDIYTRGNVVATSGTVTALLFNATSDYRIKENQEPLSSTVTVDKLRPVQYYNKISKKNDIGLIAHEVQEIYPFLVNGEKDDAKGYQSINYTGIIGILIKEIQGLKQKITKLENIIHKK
jgi:acyl-[acyl carrier protein]--UDP-N-acetylglucosamine O-acyltransferase